MSSESLSASPSPASVPSAQPAIAPSGPVSNELDLVFCIDTTGSMGSYISSAQENMKNIVTMIVASEKADVQVAIVAYKDFNDPYVTKTFDFTDSVNKMKANIDMLEASGGGDTPEAITAGLHDCLNLPYRKSSTKVVVLIGDAPDHGLGESGDSFPNGDKDGRDPIKIAREMLSRGIVIYSVACEPSLSSSQFGRDFFMTLARITQGQFLPLTSAKLLSDVIVGGAKEEISLQRIQEEVEAESKRIREEKERAKVAYSEREIAEEVSSTLQRKGVVVNKVRVDEVYAAYDYANVESMECASSLSEARSKMKSGLNRAAPSAPSDAFAYSASALDECDRSLERRPAAAPSFLGRVRNSFSSMFGGPSAPAPAPAAASFGDYGAPAPAPSSYGDYAMAPPVPSMAYAAPSSFASSAAPGPVQQAYISSSLVDSEQVLRVMNKSKSRAY